MTIIDNMGAKLHICCGIKEEKPNYFAHDFAQSQKIRADLQALPYKNVIIYLFLQNNLFIRKKRRTFALDIESEERNK